MMMTRFSMTAAATSKETILKMATTRNVVVVVAKTRRTLTSVVTPAATTTSAQSQSHSQSLFRSHPPPPRDRFSYASPESDFTAALHGVSANNSATVEGERSQQHQLSLHLSAPETAIGYTHVAETVDLDTKHDFIEYLKQQGCYSSTVLREEGETVASAPNDNNNDNKKEAAVDRSTRNPLLQWNNPESALGFVHFSEFLTEHEEETLRTNLHRNHNGKGIPECLPDLVVHPNEPSFVQNMMQFMRLSSPESAIGYSHVGEVMTAKEKEVFRALLEEKKERLFPETVQQALEDNERAIVITAAQPPFKVVDVNQVWEGLCGYTRQEAQHRPIGKLLSGPETQHERARHVMTKLVAHPEEKQEVINLVNYTKTGRKFFNHLRVGQIVDADSGERYFVGVLEEEQKRSMSA